MWVGFAFFVALVLLGFTTLLIQNVSFLGEPVYYRVHFERVLGLRAGDDVRVDGVLLGKVDRIELRPEGGVLVVLKMNQAVTLFRDAQIEVGSSSVLGGNHVAIRRGTQPPPLDTSEILTGRMKPGLDEFSELASENRDNIKTLISNLKDLTQALKDGQGTVGKLLKSDELHKEAVDTVKSVREAVGEVKGEVKKVGDNLNQNITKLTDKLTEKVDKAEGPVGALLNDKKMTEKFNRTLDNVEEATKNLRDITESVKKGEGALGKVIGDRDMGEKIKSTMDNLEATSGSIRKVADKIAAGEGTLGKLVQEDEVYESARRSLEDLERTIGRAARSTVELAGEHRQYASTHESISKLGIRITPSEDKFIYLGASIISLDPEGDVRYEKQGLDESDSVFGVDLHMGYRIPWFLDRRVTVRAGMLEGKPGASIDVLWDRWGFFTHPVQFGFEARDAYNSVEDEDLDEEIDGPMLRAYTRFPIWMRRANWFEMLLSTVEVTVGVNRIGEGPEFFAGIGLHWPDEDIRTIISLVGVAR
jgi:phospholipid/cholesterol/gamma-HCH transport system substrate-binding protein